jgi:hypothetical protein
VSESKDPTPNARKGGARALDNYAEVYTEAIYRAADVAFSLSLTPTGQTLFGGRAFALVTAYNPRSVTLHDEENRQRNAALEEELQARGLEYGPSSGASLDGSWQEPGFVVFDVTPDEARALGRRYEQHAVVWGEGERVALLWCEDGRLETFYPRVVEDV